MPRMIQADHRSHPYHDPIKTGYTHRAVESPSWTNKAQLSAMFGDESDGTDEFRLNSVAMKKENFANVVMDRDGRILASVASASSAFHITTKDRALSHLLTQLTKQTHNYITGGH